MVEQAAAPEYASGVEGGQKREDHDSEVDEDEIRDNVDMNDPPVITVAYKVGVRQVRGIGLEDGTLVFVDLQRGKSKAQTDTQPLKNSKAAFKQQISMSTTLEKRPGRTRYEAKELKLQLTNSQDQSIIGTAKIDLAEYSHAFERIKFAVDIMDSPFNGANFELQLTAKHQDVAARQPRPSARGRKSAELIQAPSKARAATSKNAAMSGSLFQSQVAPGEGQL